MVRKSRFLKPLRFRVMRFQLSRETVYRMTNLLASRRYSRTDLGMLYYPRWQVEESFKVKRRRLIIKQFTGFSPEIIRPDFHANVFSECLASALALEVGEDEEDYSDSDVGISYQSATKIQEVLPWNRPF